MGRIRKMLANPQWSPGQVPLDEGQERSCPCPQKGVLVEPQTLSLLP